MQFQDHIRNERMDSWTDKQKPICFPTFINFSKLGAEQCPPLGDMFKKNSPEQINCVGPHQNPDSL